MHTSPPPDLYKRHRFPVEIISHFIWLYDRFSLSYRDVEELMAERGVTLSHEAVGTVIARAHCSICAIGQTGKAAARV
jgi:transposase-like protein